MLESILSGILGAQEVRKKQVASKVEAHTVKRILERCFIQVAYIKIYVGIFALLITDVNKRC